MDEISQIALIGLWKAAMRHEPTRGAFSTFASRWVDGVIRQHLRRWRPLEPLPADEDGGPVDVVDERSGEGNEAVDAEEAVAELLDALTPRLRAMVVRRFGLGGCPEHTQAELAVQFGVSQARVGQLLNRALHQLRSHARQERSRHHVHFPSQ